MSTFAITYMGLTNNGVRYIEKESYLDLLLEILMFTFGIDKELLQEEIFSFDDVKEVSNYFERINGREGFDMIVSIIQIDTATPPTSFNTKFITEYGDFEI